MRKGCRIERKNVLVAISFVLLFIGTSQSQSIVASFAQQMNMDCSRSIELYSDGTYTMRWGCLNEQYAVMGEYKKHRDTVELSQYNIENYIIKDIAFFEDPENKEMQIEFYDKSNKPFSSQIFVSNVETGRMWERNNVLPEAGKKDLAIGSSSKYSISHNSEISIGLLTLSEFSNTRKMIELGEHANHVRIYTNIPTTLAAELEQTMRKYKVLTARTFTMDNFVFILN